MTPNPPAPLVPSTLASARYLLEAIGCDDWSKEFFWMTHARAPAAAEQKLLRLAARWRGATHYANDGRCRNWSAELTTFVREIGAR